MWCYIWGYLAAEVHTSIILAMLDLKEKNVHIMMMVWHLRILAVLPMMPTINISRENSIVVVWYLLMMIVLQASSYNHFPPLICEFTTTWRLTLQLNYVPTLSISICPQLGVGQEELCTRIVVMILRCIIHNHHHTNNAHHQCLHDYVCRNTYQQVAKWLA